MFKLLCDHVFIPLTSLEVEWLDHIISYLTFEELPDFSKAPAQFTHPLVMYDFPHPSQSLLLSLKLQLSNKSGFLQLCFPNDMNVFSCAYCPFIDLEKYLFKSFTQFLTVLSIALLFKEFFIYSNTMICKHSSHSVGCLFTGCLACNTEVFHLAVAHLRLVVS